MSTSETPRRCCKLCGAPDQVVVRRPVPKRGLNPRAWQIAPEGTLASEYYLPATCTVLQPSGLCSFCDQNHPDADPKQLTLLGDA